MIMVILVLVVLAQITLFQFLAALANRSIIIEEVSRLTGTAPNSVTDHARIAPIVRMGIGGALACVALLALFGLTDQPFTAKIVILGVSAVSAAVFAFGQVKDRGVMRDLADAASGGGVRQASLARRTLDGWYHPALEVIPLVVFIATAVFLISTPGFAAGAEQLGEQPRILVYFGLQGLLMIGGLYRGLRPVVGIRSITQYIPSLRSNPEVSIRLGEELAGTQLRFFLVAKIGFSLLLGSLVAKNVLTAAGSSAAAPWSILGWCIVGVLVVMYGFYFSRIGSISRRMQKQMDPANS